MQLPGTAVHWHWKVAVSLLSPFTISRLPDTRAVAPLSIRTDVDAFWAAAGRAACASASFVVAPAADAATGISRTSATTRARRIDSKRARFAGPPFAVKMGPPRSEGSDMHSGSTFCAPARITATSAGMARAAPPNRGLRRLSGATVLAVASVLALAPGTPAFAQGVAGFPSKPVRVVVPFAPGGATDTVARMVAQRLGERFGQTFVVENKPGAANVIANDLVAKAAPDGHTLLFAAAPIALNTALGMKLPYDVARDFAPISLVASIPILVVAHPGTPYRTLDDVVAAARRDPKGMNYATAGVGSVPHLLGEWFRARTGAPLTHIGYKGAAPALKDALAGVVPVMLDAYIPTGAQVAAGKLRGIAIGSAKRSPLLPDVPTFAEAGFPDLQIYIWSALLAPAATPAPIVARLNAVFTKILRSDEIRSLWRDVDFEPLPTTPTEAAAFFAADSRRWAEAVRISGFKPTE